MSEEEAEEILKEHGFEKKPGGGSGDRWVHEDGSEVHIGSDGIVSRSGKKRPDPSNPHNGKWRRTRYRPDGSEIKFIQDPSKRPKRHFTDEKIRRK